MTDRCFYLKILLTGFASGLWMLTMTGCTVGPNYQTPKSEMPQQWSESSKGVEPAGAQAGVDVTRWWSLFQDSELDSLVNRAVQSNKDLIVAEARIREARAQRVVVASSAYPFVETTNAYSHVRSSGNSSPKSSTSAAPSPSNSSGTSGLEQDLFQVGFDASWELDVFGRTRRNVEAADADIAASVENKRDVMVTLLSEVAQTYLQVRGNQLRIKIARDNIAAQKQTLELTQARFDAGLSSELNVAQAKAQLANTETQIPSLESSVRQGIHQLGVLLGQKPELLIDELSAEEPLPPVPPQVPIGLPSELLRRRPDVRRAERQLAAGTARIGAATADLFPSFSLTGSLGMLSADAGTLMNAGSRFWSLGPTIRWPIFDAGKIRANIQVQNARQEQLLATYEKAVLSALADVEDSLVAYGKEQESQRSLVDAVAANQRAFDIGNELYSKGLVDFLNVLDSQRALYLSQDALAQSQQRVTTNLVALFKALGGGWEATAEYGAAGPEVSQAKAPKM